MAERLVGDWCLELRVSLFPSPPRSDSGIFAPMALRGPGLLGKGVVMEQHARDPDRCRSEAGGTHGDGTKFASDLDVEARPRASTKIQDPKAGA